MATKFDTIDNTPIRNYPELTPDHPNYYRFKVQAWCKIIGRKCPKGSKNYNKNFLNWCYNTMVTRDKLREEDLKYLRKVLSLKWKEIDNHEKQEAKVKARKEAKND